MIQDNIRDDLHNLKVRAFNALIKMNIQIENNLNTFDEEGFCFLTNIIKGTKMPLNFAYSLGFKLPIFKITNPKVTEENKRKDMEENLEGIWVKEGIKNG